MIPIKEKIQELLSKGDEIRAVEQQFDIYGSMGVKGKMTDKWINDVLILSSKLPDKHPLIEQIKKTYSHKGMASTFDKMYSYLESLRDDETLEVKTMTHYNTISPEAKNVLDEIISNEHNSDYWKNRFNGLSRKDDAILRGCFKELKENQLISVSWADNIPYIINVLKDGYLYDGHIKSIDVPTLPNEKWQNYSKYDVFLSHANKDKKDLVEELYQSLSKLGINIFYDKESLEWGDKWKERIQNGTNEAEFAIIVISENFFDREWTEKELSKFLSRQNSNGQKLILPIVHNITNEQLREKYPNVADIQAIDSREYSCDQIALLFAKQLIKRLKSN